jgi:hypothetical protein
MTFLATVGFLVEPLPGCHLGYILAIKLNRSFLGTLELRKLSTEAFISNTRCRCDLNATQETKLGNGSNGKEPLY